MAIYYPSKIENPKEILSSLLQNILGNRLTSLEEKNNNENNNLFEMIEQSNNMVSFLEESSKKINITKNNEPIKSDINIINENKVNDNFNLIVENNFSKTSTNIFYDNENKKEKNEEIDSSKFKAIEKKEPKPQSNTPLEITPIRVKRLNSKDKSLTIKKINKKQISITPISTASDKKLKFNLNIKNETTKCRNLNKFTYLKKNLNSDYISENYNILNENKENKDNKEESNKKKKIIIHLRYKNNSMLVTKQNSFMSNKTNQSKSKDKKRNSKNKYNRTITPLSVRNIKDKFTHNKSNKFASTSKKKKGINKEKENEKSKTMRNFYKRNKLTLKREKYDQFEYRYKISDLSKELELLCENDYFDNDKRLDRLMLNDKSRGGIKIPSPKQNDLESKLISIDQCLPKNINKDDLLTSDNYLYLKCRKKSTNKINKEEQLESCIEYIKDYLSNNDLFNLGLINKEFFKIILRFLISRTEKKIEIIKGKISDLTKKYKNINMNSKDINQFECNINSTRAIILLNSISINNLFKPSSPLMNNSDVIFIFELFFIAIGKKSEILKYNKITESRNNKRWMHICKYFKDNENKLLGNIIEKELINNKFNNEIINSLYEWSHNKINIITPNYFQKINKDIAILVFIIRDLLECFGISQEKKINPQKLYILHNIRKNLEETINKKLNELLIRVK